jgi:hypothetical protein
MKWTLLLIILISIYYYFTRIPINEIKTSIEASTNEESQNVDNKLDEEITSSNVVLLKKVDNETKPEARATSKVKNKLSITTTSISIIKPDDFNISTAFETDTYHNAFLSSYRKGSYKEVIEFGKNLLKIPNSYASNFWYGDFCHQTNIILGKIYLKTGNIKNAEYHLIKSVDKRYIKASFKEIYSPTLASFGPDRSLAYDLFKKGRRKSIINYFQRTKSFWKTGVENGIIDKAIYNIVNDKSDDQVYMDQDDSNYPFRRTEYVVDYDKSPIFSND